uniref:(northern house mosquito) hypothetical protein n=1 Tax=Culex pipiens TaxID=7175 RepID=A0A8D8A9Y0_CULPI
MLPDGRTAAGHGPADGLAAGPNSGRATSPQRWRSGPRTATLVDRLRFVDRIDELHTGHLVHGTTTASKITDGSGTSRRGATSRRLVNIPESLHLNEVNVNKNTATKFSTKKQHHGASQSTPLFPKPKATARPFMALSQASERKKKRYFVSYCKSPPHQPWGKISNVLVVARLVVPGPVMMENYSAQFREAAHHYSSGELEGNLRR